jgi:hypothetical protein
MNQIPGLTSGWLVRVSAADGLGRRTERDYWVGEAEKSAAERLVRANLTNGERVHGVKPLFISELVSFGVARGEVKYRPAVADASPRPGASNRLARDDRARRDGSPAKLNARRFESDVPRLGPPGKSHS